MKAVVYGGIIIVALAGATGLMFDQMKKMDIENLILCSSNEGGMWIPHYVCLDYLLNYRVNEADVKQLSQGAGLDYILNTNRWDKYLIAKAFLAKGLDVNGVNHYSDQGITPLHGAVLLNDLERVKFLISQGADTRIKTKRDGLTALDLAKKLTKKDLVDDREDIIAALSAVRGK